MSFSPEIEAFIRDFAADVSKGTAAVFAGAGMSKASGFVDWPELLRDIAEELQLNVDRERDLISVAQYHVNSRGGSTKLAKKILEEFGQHAEPGEVHDLLAQLPIDTYWTTNYDDLIERALAKEYKVADVKHNVEQLRMTRPKRDAVVYKMHGDASDASKAVIYKAQYETYYRTHSSFVTALSGDLVSKTFLFIGFSFTDPNLDYVLSRLRVEGTGRDHYCFVRREARRAGEDEDEFKYRRRKQELHTSDLRRFGIQALLIDEFAEIPKVLREISARYRRRTVFVSGSAERFDPWTQDAALTFVADVTEQTVKSGFRVVNGFGWGIGSAVINGALKAIYENPGKCSEEQLVLRPFPQTGTDLKRLWDEYRKRMISRAGIAVFVFGNKRQGKDVVDAGGVRREFEIAVELGVIPLPIGATGSMAEQLWNEVVKEPNRYYGEAASWIVPLINGLSSTDPDVLAKRIHTILSRIAK